MTLAAVKLGETVRVKNVGCGGLIKQRLLDLGVVAGADLTVVSYAPLGDPMIVELNDGLFALRKSDALCIAVGEKP